MKLAIVIPVFNEEALLAELKRRLDRVLADIGEDYGVIFVNDGSTDASLEILKTFAAADQRVTVVNLSRNFGHQQSLTAGLSLADGDAVVIMDGDLEDPPEVIVQLLAKWKEGFKVVTAQRRSRNVGPLKGLLFRGFHRLFQFLSDFPMPLDSGVFCLLDRSACRHLVAFGETNRFIPGLRSWVGFRSATVWYDRGARYAGQPKQTLRRLVKYALDAIFSFSYKPLRVSLVLGLFLFLLSTSYAFVLVVLRILNINVVSGFTTTSVAILFFGGVILVSNGILGEYLGRIYDEVKRRPLYIIDEVIGHKPKS
jgi:glycosyltransferase involved in cell wall biosynthesis